MSFDVIIVGAGPGGLACASITAAQGLKTLILEKGESIGRKVCAGGVTWNGLVKRIPSRIFEQQFHTQKIFTTSQKASITEKTPVIATVNRISLGLEMCRNSLQAGAELWLGSQVTSLSKNEVVVYDKNSKTTKRMRFSFLVGADGSMSCVRRHLGLPLRNRGVGINYQIPCSYPHMEWHLDYSLFGSGYAWIFPHSKTISVGAYADARTMKAKRLKENLVTWGKKRDLQLDRYKCQAEYINFDYRGYRFDNVFLVGDAAGLASGLTGEGIYPAIVSGEAVGRLIVDPKYKALELDRMIRNHARHSRLVTVLGKNSLVTTFLGEIVVYCLKRKLMSFGAIEMAH